MYREFYEGFYANLKKCNKVEDLKQGLRLRVIHELIQGDSMPNNKILIIGCGKGQDTTVTNRKVYAFDFAYSAIKTAKINFPGHIYLVADATCMPFISNYFDTVICSEVIEHVTNPKMVFSEIQRVLRPHGELILTTPNWICWFGLARKLAEFIFREPFTAANQPIDDWYTFRKLRKQLEQNFKIIEVRGVWYFPPTGRGTRVIPDFLIFPLFRYLQSFDTFLGKVLPTIGGHFLAIKCIKKYDKEFCSQY